MRVHILAKDLNVPSKLIIDKCKAEGIDSVKNHMSTLSAGLHATIVEWFSDGKHDTTVETSDRVDLTRARGPAKELRAGTDEFERPAAELESRGERGSSAVAVADAPPEVTVIAPPLRVVARAEREPVPQPRMAPEIHVPPVVQAGPTSPVTSPVTPAAPSVVPPPAVPPVVAETTESATVAEKPTEPRAEAAPPKSVKPAGPQNVPQAARLQGPRVVRYEAPDYDSPPRGRPTVGRSATYDPSAPPVPRVGGGTAIPPTPGEAAEREAAKRKGRANPRRAAGRAVEAGEKLAEWNDRDLAERAERLAGATGRRIHRRRGPTPSGPQPRQPSGPKTRAVVHEPVRLKEFCAETGLNFLQLLKVLRDEHGVLANVNMTLANDMAQLLALHFGIELDVVPARTKLDEIRDEFAARPRTELQPRPPVVTILGHVDHGKTSLLDTIRKSQVAAGEDGGITQHIRSYHIETGHGAVTFLDTPGHVAFTAMRARGAQITDVVVLVVAINDGIMPQTVEAIRHAQAANVPVVVALNKIDLGDQNKLKVFGQLSEHGLTPSGDWGGHVDVIETSAQTGQGVTRLVEHLADLSTLMELKADPTLPACGTVIEAETKSGVGAVVQLLVREGTLRVGDFAVCGNAYGKVRAMQDDRGRRIQEAGPAMPVEVWGLDEVPLSGDMLYVVENLQRAKDIATETRQLRIETARAQTRKAKTLEEMFQRRDTSEVPELNVVLKADVDGSVAALKQSLAEIPSDEVRLTIRHAAVGPVNDSDILLAAACDGLVIAFRVDTSGGAKRLADQHGVEIRGYRVIYDVCDEIRKALSGLLAPEVKIESRGTAEVREVFRMKKIGVIAGCYVTDGTIERSHVAKVVRDGVVVRDGCKLASLRHFKDDVKEVRAGLECGIRLDGFDDLHVGDRIQAYEIIKIARSL